MDWQLTHQRIVRQGNVHQKIGCDQCLTFAEVDYREMDKRHAKRVFAHLKLMLRAAGCPHDRVDRSIGMDD